MRTIINFILKQHNIIIFLALEIYAIIITITYSDYHHNISYSIINEFIGNIHNAYYSLYKYVNTVDENKKLANQNAELLTELLNFKDNNSFATDSNIEKIYKAIPANVVYLNVHQRTNYIIINKGYNDSIEPDMGVISSEGVVGVVKDVSANFSTIIPIINVNAHISAKIKKNNHFGTTTWDGKNYRIVQLCNIPYHVKVRIGDTVVTSGFSTIFPEGIMIGKIINYNYSEGNDFYYIEIQLSTDFNSLNNVYVIKNSLKNEYKKIENKIKDVQ